MVVPSVAWKRGEEGLVEGLDGEVKKERGDREGESFRRVEER